MARINLSLCMAFMVASGAMFAASGTFLTLPHYLRKLPKFSKDVEPFAYGGITKYVDGLEKACPPTPEFKTFFSKLHDYMNTVNSASSMSGSMDSKTFESQMKGKTEGLYNAMSQLSGGKTGSADAAKMLQTVQSLVKTLMEHKRSGSSKLTVEQQQTIQSSISKCAQGIGQFVSTAAQKKGGKSIDFSATVSSGSDSDGDGNDEDGGDNKSSGGTSGSSDKGSSATGGGSSAADASGKSSDKSSSATGSGSSVSGSSSITAGSSGAGASGKSSDKSSSETGSGSSGAGAGPSPVTGGSTSGPESSPKTSGSGASSSISGSGSSSASGSSSITAGSGSSGSSSGSASAEAGGSASGSMDGSSGAGKDKGKDCGPAGASRRKGGSGDMHVHGTMDYKSSAKKSHDASSYRISSDMKNSGKFRFHNK